MIIHKTWISQQGELYWVQAPDNIKVRPAFESTAHGIVHQH